MQDRGSGGEPGRGAERQGAFPSIETLDTRAVLARGVGVLWRGFDVQNLSRWFTTQVQDGSTGGVINKDRGLALTRISVQTFGMPHWRHFGEDYLTYFTVRPNADSRGRPKGVSRTELTHYPVGGSPEGSEYYYRWSTWFPERDETGRLLFPIGDGIGGIWQGFTQWHQASDNGSPPIFFSVKRERNGSPYIGLEFQGGAASWKTPFHYDMWHNFVLYVKYSNYSRLGRVGLWYSRYSEPLQQVAPFWQVRTTATRSGAGPYLKQGLYRSRNFYGDKTSVVVHCGMTEGSSLDAVMPRFT